VNTTESPARLTTAGGHGVGALCLGAMYFGTRVEERTAFGILDRFLDAGGTFVDTSNNYAFWEPGAAGQESESLLGRWLGRTGRRDRVLLATKVGARPRTRGAGFEDAEGLAPSVVAQQADASLRRLGTDRIDLYYAHIEDPAVPLEQCVEGFSRLVGTGRVRAVGCSNHATATVLKARRIAREAGLTPFTHVQQRYSYLRPRPDADFAPQVALDDALIDYARVERDLTLLAYSPLLSGAFTRADRALPEQYLHPGTQARLAALREAAREIGATPNQVALAWLLAGEVPIIPVIGVSSVEQLDECLGALTLKLPPELRDRLTD
jgi:aryl-alcohol dehydrogenase-like predicted oxidoreductase